jgi:polyisoprenoid-binding protein YceI
MKEKAPASRRSGVLIPVLVALCFLTLARMEAAAQEVAFGFDPQHTTINFTLGDVLHTVRGTFRLKEGALHFVGASGKLTGGIVVDARSGESGNGMRDRKMHKEVLESDRYPDIAFHPDHVEGNVSPQGKSSVQVHGIFTIHGADHELTVPAEVETFQDHWTAMLHFVVPYTKWGMQNPSTLFLRVNESVDIDVTASGSVARP